MDGTIRWNTTIVGAVVVKFSDRADHVTDSACTVIWAVHNSFNEIQVHLKQRPFAC